MRLFNCQSCGNIVYFENTHCENCKHRLGYCPEQGLPLALEPSDGAWLAVNGDATTRRFCINAEHDACNWLTPANTMDAYCLACRHNEIIPALDQPENIVAWRKIELAKHRLFYSLIRWRLPLETRLENPSHGLVFRFLGDSPATGPKVMTGHDDGLITIALLEANDAEREARRTRMGEPYRTLLGHFRHEVGHHYWDILVRDGGKVDACRDIFGDDRQDYGAALHRHYQQGTPENWQETFVSSYATSHPWEDFAETWAHYLHIVDTLEMAGAFGMEVRPRIDQQGSLVARVDFDPYAIPDIQPVMEAWLPFVFAMNSISRAMGQNDLYPFVIAPSVVKKLGFIHDLVRG
jgi:hypothetical protein